MSLPHFRLSLNISAGLTVFIGLSWLLSCSSIDEAPGGGHIEHPVDPVSRKAAASPVPSPGSAAAPTLSSVASAAPPASAIEALSEPQVPSKDKAILDDCPAQPWSKNVPKRACTKDEQCGDGFCDRERCAPLWTCSIPYSKRCEGDAQCGSPFLCINGRCSSCVSDAECKSSPDNQNPKCVPYPTMPGVVVCHGVTPHTMGIPARGPLPK